MSIDWHDEETLPVYGVMNFNLLRIVISIARSEKERLNTFEIAEETGIAQSNVSTIIRNLVASNVLNPSRTGYSLNKDLEELTARDVLEAGRIERKRKIVFIEEAIIAKAISASCDISMADLMRMADEQGE